MAVRIKFDGSHNPLPPTLVLATRSGVKLGALPAVNILVSDKFNSSFELNFDVYQYDDGEECELWDKITNFKLVWCREWDVWFEIYVEQQDGDSPLKSVTAVSVCEAELSQVNLYDIEINTEDDIARDDYEITVLYNSDKPEGSLLNRISEKIPHYTIKHVDSRIASIQRTFTFDNISIYDAMQEIAEEIDCIFIFDSGTDDDGNIARTISVYDLESYCYDCHTRGEFLDTCSECGSTNITRGYGDDTSIFISKDNLADEITYSTDTASVKNCFRLEAGDELMTATIRNCNPNQTQYIWYFSDELKADMSDELVAKIDSYDELYDYYQNEHVIELDSTLLGKYNSLVEKYESYNDEIETISSSIVGYPALMQAYYDTLDFYLFLNDEFMPDASLADTTAEEQAALLTVSNLSPVAVQDLDSCSSSTASSAVLSVAKVVCDSRYQVKVSSSSYSDGVWTGNFIVTNYSDEEDTATSSEISITLNDDYETYIRQKISKALKNAEDDAEDDNIATDISGLFTSSLSSFTTQLTYYCMTCLNLFYDACQTCLDILIEQGIADKQTWADQNPDLYTELYLDYYDKLLAIEDEISVRETELAIIEGVYDSDGNLTADGLQTIIVDERNAIQSELNFEDYLGDDLLKEFAAYRREETYTNDNYISDGLTNAELFANALEFLEGAEKEIYKSATQQHSITATLNNLLVMEEFTPIVDNFAVGNWLRIKVDDKLYRLRLITYQINFEDFTDFSIEFSDVKEVANGITDTQSIFNQAVSMAGSYGEVAKNANSGASANSYLSHWVEDGLDVTNQRIIQGASNQEQSWDSHGMLFRKYDDVTDDYSDTQLKIVNSTMAITDDNWKTVKTAVGNYYYFDPETGELKSAYGIIAETLVGKLILGENLGIYNSTLTFKVDTDGVTVTNGTNTLVINPSSESLFVLSNEDGNILWVDENGQATFSGALTVTNGVNTLSIDPSATNLFVLSNSEQDIFYVDEDGNATFSGTISASSGEIAGWLIGTTSLKSSNGLMSINSSTQKITCGDTDGVQAIYSNVGESIYYDGTHFGDFGFRAIYWTDDEGNVTNNLRGYVLAPKVYAEDICMGYGIVAWDSTLGAYQRQMFYDWQEEWFYFYKPVTVLALTEDDPYWVKDITFDDDNQSFTVTAGRGAYAVTTYDVTNTYTYTMDADGNITSITNQTTGKCMTVNYK